MEKRQYPYDLKRRAEALRKQAYARGNVPNGQKVGSLDVYHDPDPAYTRQLLDEAARLDELADKEFERLDPMEKMSYDLYEALKAKLTKQGAK